MDRVGRSSSDAPRAVERGRRTSSSSEAASRSSEPSSRRNGASRVLMLRVELKSRSRTARFLGSPSKKYARYFWLIDSRVASGARSARRFALRSRRSRFTSPRACQYGTPIPCAAGRYAVGPFKLVQVFLECIIAAPAPGARGRPGGKTRVAERTQVAIVLRIVRSERVGAKALCAGRRKPEGGCRDAQSREQKSNPLSASRGHASVSP